ncbi:hypothetical protein [Emticicia sp. 17c]|uniref:hypothetical protein n=1 Tax=Emticicia sp. 17c TaxID=3127704 RepID=UPI00301CEF10
MKNFLILKPGPPSARVIMLVYYLLQLLTIAASVLLILDGIADPFGLFLIIAGVVMLVFVPMLWRIIFGLILKTAKDA